MTRRPPGASCARSAGGGTARGGRDGDRVERRLRREAQRAVAVVHVHPIGVTRGSEAARADRRAPEIRSIECTSAASSASTAA